MQQFLPTHTHMHKKQCLLLQRGRSQNTRLQEPQPEIYTCDFSTNSASVYSVNNMKQGKKLFSSNAMRGGGWGTSSLDLKKKKKKTLWCFSFKEMALRLRDRSAKGALLKPSLTCIQQTRSLMTSTGKACNSSRRMIYVASARKKMHSLANMSRNEASPTRSEQRLEAPELREAHGKRQS